MSIKFNTSTLYRRNEDGSFSPVPVVRGEKGEAFTYDDFTPEQLETLKGEPGKDGSDAAVTEANVKTALGMENDDQVATKGDLSHYVKTVNGTAPDANGNVVVSGGGGVYDDTELRCEVAEVKNIADGKYSKPESGIPASDLAAGVVPDIVTDEHINTLIDAKLSDVEPLADAILGVM